MKWKIGNVEINNRIVLAPMAGITNECYRSIIKEMGAGLIYTEMVSVNGLVYNSKKTIDMLKINDSERPVSLQIFGSDVESFVKAATFIEKHAHPDIIDINMGCPVPKIALKNQAGSALLKDPNKIYEIVKSVVECTNTPITVKIRSGWDDNNINAIEVAKLIEKAGASAICVHPRTRKQGYTGKANWDIIRQVKENVNIPVIGNGDITNINEAKKMLEETKCDAIMIGRACLGNPWLIKECVEYIENNNISKEIPIYNKVDMIIKHYNLLKESYGEKSALLQIRTHALYYIKHIKNDKELKNSIMKCTNEKEFMELINDYKNKLIDK